MELGVHFEGPQELGSILIQGLQLPHEVIVYLARVAEAVHLPPVFVEGCQLLGVWVQQVLDEVGEGDLEAGAEGLAHGGGQAGVVGVQPEHGHGKLAVELLVLQLELAAESRDEAHEGVAHKQELGVLLQLDLHEVPRELPVAAPELVEGQVRAGVVHVLPGDVQGVSVGAAPVQQALAQHDHHSLPVGTGHLGHVAVDDPVAIVHDQVVEFVVGDVIERAVLGGECQAGVGTEVSQQAPPLGLLPVPVWVLLGIMGGPVVASHALLHVAQDRLAGAEHWGLLCFSSGKVRLLRIGTKQCIQKLIHIRSKHVLTAQPRSGKGLQDVWPG